MNSKYKIVALDLDGTLTNNKKEIAEGTYKALMSVQHAGIRLVLASGRPTYGVAHLARQLQLDRFSGYMLSYNGGKITSCGDGRILARHTLDLSLIPLIYQYAKDAGQAIITYAHDAIVTEDAEHEVVKLESVYNNNMPIRKVKDFVDAIESEPFKLAIVGDKTALDKLNIELQRFSSGRISLFRSSENYLEIVPSNVDKARSLAYLLSEIGLPSSAMIAVGDTYNDVPMIQMAGLGVAMGNATEAVKQCADYITTSNEEGGVEHLMHKVFLSPPKKEEVDLNEFNQMMQNTLMSSLGIQCTLLEEGHVEATMPVDMRNRQPMGILHGGATLALAETLAGYGSIFMLGENEMQVGMQVSGNHISSAHEGDVVKGVATIIHKGRSTHVWNIDVITESGKIISSIRVVNSIIKRR